MKSSKAGKGSDNRTKDWKKYRSEYDRIFKKNKTKSDNTDDIFKDYSGL